MEEINKENIIKQPVKEVVKLLSTDLNKGLAEVEVQNRLRKYGENVIEEKKENPLINLAKKFWNPSAWVLEAAAILSYVLGKYLDFYIIIALIVFNAILSFSEEQRANKALEMLKSRLQVTARVLRDGNWRNIPSRYLVPGDVVRIRLGDFVPADIKIVEGQLEVDQSALTGESLTVTKNKEQQLWDFNVT